MSELSPSPAPFAIRVLLIDDQRMVGEAVRRMVVNEPNLVFEFCQKPEEAIATAERFQPTVILQDLVMPGIDGLTLVECYRANPATRAVPTIVLSSQEEPLVKAEAFARGANDYLVKLPDRIELLARIKHHSQGYIHLLERNAAFDALAASQIELQTEKNRLEVTQRRLDSELNEAGRYGTSIFPPPSEAPLKINWFYQPSAELGGDSFGYHWIDDDHFAVYLLDVCGHGVGPALLSVTAINQIRSGSIPNVDMRDPSEVLAALSNIFLMEKQNDMYFTLWYGVYHAPTRRLCHASAGHPAALLLIPQVEGGFRTEQVLECNMIIGMMEDISYTSAVTPVPEGAHLIVLCDGCFEILDTNGVELSFDDFESFVRDNAVHDDILERTFKWAQLQHGPGPLDDDFSMVRIQL